MRKFVCYAFINLVSLIFGQSGICLGHRELTLVLVGREFRPLTIKIQRVALATEIRGFLNTLSRLKTNLRLPFLHRVVRVWRPVLLT